MPIYEYDCPECGRIEAIQRISDEPLRYCPVCSGAGKQNEVSRCISRSAFHLKGSGWYKTDYASKSNGSNGNGHAHAPKNDAKETTAAKSESKSESGGKGEGSSKSEGSSASSTSSPSSSSSS